MRVLYVLGSQGTDTTEPMESLVALEPDLQVESAAGAAAALVELRARGGYQAVFLSPQLPSNEAWALIATLRRDRMPVAIVSILRDDQRPLFTQAVTAGADDAVVLHEFGLEMPKETLRRIRASRHLELPEGRPLLRVLYVGQDQVAIDSLADLPFAIVEPTIADPDGTTSLGVGETGARAEVVVVDEQPGEGHALRVVKWLEAHEPDLPIVFLTPPNGLDLGGAALDLGATDVVSKSGTYGRRLASTLARHARKGQSLTPRFPAVPHRTLRERERIAVEPEPDTDQAEPEPFLASPPVAPDAPDVPAAPEEPVAPVAPVVPAGPDPRVAELTAELEQLGAQVEAQRLRYEETQETLAFERAMRERDREEMARLRQSLNEEHDRRVVLEGTLRHTEDRASTDRQHAESTHATVLESLEQHVTRLQDEVTTRTAERDRLIQHELFGWATATQEGVLVACNTAFARMFGYDDPADAIADSADGFAGLTDHAFLVEQLRLGKKVDRVQSVLQRADGRPFRALTSAAFLPSTETEPAQVEMMLIDLEDRSRLDEQLRLARRLEAAGRLAAEMSPELEAVVPSLEQPDGALTERRRAAMLVRQLVAFSRHQAKPAGLLSLNDAIRRAEPVLRQVAGDLAPVSLVLDDPGPIAASEDDIEQLLSALTFAAAACLPYGGALTFRTRTIREGFDQRTELSVTASGYGVQPISVSSFLTRLVTKCGGVVQSTDDPARATTLHVFLPC